ITRITQSALVSKLPKTASIGPPSCARTPNNGTSSVVVMGKEACPSGPAPSPAGSSIGKRIPRDLRESSGPRLVEGEVPDPQVGERHRDPDHPDRRAVPGPIHELAAVAWERGEG